MLRADEEKILWLFENYSGYRIAKESGVSQSIIARVMNGTRELKNVSFETANKLTECAERFIRDDFKR
jgi:bacterial regulatory proteins, lacI family